MIKGLWSWIKSILARLFHRSAKSETLNVPTDLDQKLGQRIQKRMERQERLINTRGFGPRMPKSQPCPSCRRRSKRIRKTAGGAQYYCSRCKQGFFIRAR